MGAAWRPGPGTQIPNLLQNSIPDWPRNFNPKPCAARQNSPLALDIWARALYIYKRYTAKPRGAAPGFAARSGRRKDIFYERNFIL